MHGLRGKELEVASISQRLNLDFLAVQETFWKQGTPPYLPGYWWLGRESLVTPGRKGVSLLVKEKWQSICTRVAPISTYEGIIAVRL